MEALRRNSILLSLGLCAVLGSRDAGAQDAWSFELIPSAWTTGLDGRLATGAVTAEPDSSVSDLLEFDNLGGSLRFTARRDWLWLFGEASFVEHDTPLNVNQVIAEAGVGYAFNDALAVYGGARYQDVDSEIVAGDVTAAGAQSWVDGMVGAQWTPVATRHWLLWLRSDIGGGGSDKTWQFETGVAAGWSDRYGIYLVYRMLSTDYRRDDFIYDIEQDGVLLGFGFRF